MSWREYVITPLFVAGITAVKQIYGEGHSITSPLTIAEILANVTGYEVAKLFTELFLDKMLTSEILVEGTDHVIEPIIHGIIVGLVPMSLLGANDVYNLSATGSLRRDRKLTIAANETFATKFADGLTINILSSWLAQPLTDNV